MLIAVCCDRGAPGSTTTALALGVAWHGESIVVEADPYGGDLALRCRVPGGGVLPEAPTVLTVAVAARTDASADLVGRYAHRFAESTRVVPGHLAAEQGTGVSDWTPLARALRASGTPVVIDLGRIHAQSPSLPLAAAADVLVTVGRADLGSVVHLRERLSRLVPALAESRATPPVMLPVVVAPHRAAAVHAEQIRALLSDTAAGPMVAGVAWIAWDPGAVERLERGEGAQALSKTRLLRSARTVNEQILRVTPARIDESPSEAGHRVMEAR